MLKVTSEPIDVNEALDFVRHPSCGAVTMFEGNIRNENLGEKVLHLEYEVYEALLHREVARLIDEVQTRWSIHKVALIQRTGILQVGSTGIVIAVGSAHRGDALKALEYLIEEFKKRAPVWKRERTENSEKWINWSPQITQ